MYGAAQFARVLRKSCVGEVIFRLPGKAEYHLHQSSDSHGRAQSPPDRLSHAGCRFHAAVDVDIARDVRFDDRQLIRRHEHSAKRSRPVQNQRERRLRIPAAIDGAIPESHVERALMWLAE